MRVWHLLVLPLGLCGATPVPPPGPGTDKNGDLLLHNATCPATGFAFDFAPTFHVADECHNENDPNAPFFFNGMYHLFYQDHVLGGVVGGHAASPDLVHWKRLEVALWNDRWYDDNSVYTFSATIVDDGTPVLVYPGLTDGSTTGFCLAQAVPANLSDPWLQDWVKPDTNPIRCEHEVERDPSTAWRTSWGEWRMTYYHGGVYASTDFTRWDYVGGLFGNAECPDFFPLPRACDGCDDWFHPACVGMTIKQAAALKSYVCGQCQL